VPDAATSILAPQKLGYAGAFRFFCLGDTLGVEDAKALGLVGEIVTQGSAEEATLARAKQLAKKPVAALLQTRSLLKGDTGVLCDRIDHEITLFQQALQDDTTLKRLQRIARLAA